MSLNNVVDAKIIQHYHHHHYHWYHHGWISFIVDEIH
jgi:hypothetical protein